MSEHPERWDRLRRAIDKQVTALGIGPVELEKRSGVSRETFRPILKGTPGNYRPATLAKLGRALDLAPDHLQRILEGEADDDRTEQTDTHSKIAYLDDDDQRMVNALIDRLAEAKRAREGR